MPHKIVIPKPSPPPKPKLKECTKFLCCTDGTKPTSACTNIGVCGCKVIPHTQHVGNLQLNSAVV